MEFEEQFKKTVKKNMTVKRSELGAILDILYPDDNDKLETLIPLISELKKKEQVYIVNSLIIARKQTVSDWYREFVEDYIADYLKYTISISREGRKEAIDIALMRDRDALREASLSERLRKALPFLRDNKT